MPTRPRGLCCMLLRSAALRTAVRMPLRTAATARLPLRIHRCAVRTRLPRAARCCLHRLESFARSTTHPVLLLRCAHAAGLP